MEVVGFIIIAVVVIIIIFANGMMNERKMKKLYALRLLSDYGKNSDRKYKDGEFEHIVGYDNSHNSDFHLDTITWNDLDMDTIFKQMNYTKSSAGEEYLYHLLKCPAVNGQDYSVLEEKITYFMQHEKERQTLQLALHEMGRTGKYSIYDYLKNLEVLGKRSNKKDIIADLLFIPAIFLLFYNIGYGIAFIFLLILYNIITYFKEKEKIDPYITCFAYVFRIIKGVDLLNSKRIEQINEEQEKLKNLKKKFTKFKRFSFLIMSKSRMTGNPTEIVIDYARMFLHIDIIKFNSMLHEVKLHWNDIDEMLHIIGKIDVYLSIGEYRNHLHEYCVPVFEKDKYQVKQIYHPLLENPVKNDIDVKRSILLTGSNASGKSTFLKTIAVNAILAQSIHTVAASEYHANQYKIFTSLALKDNIFNGESYYMAEIKSIKRIIDESNKGDVPLLGFVDEVLRGTNTVERIAASSVVLKILSKAKGFMFAATHDLELTDILNHDYDNYHFEEYIKDGDVSFPYLIKFGKATSRNAIKLLEMMQYDKDIVREANNMAEEFEKTGIWEEV